MTFKTRFITNLKYSSPRNPFVETSISYALTYTASITSPFDFELPYSISITILADDDYYSEAPASCDSRPSHFANFGVPLFSAHKTGLGSSAALVTSLTSALVLHRLCNGANSGNELGSSDASGLPVMRDKLHILAQVAHCAAQGKIGSGFDVAAAVYGSCNYRRFSPDVFETLSDSGVGSAGFAEELFAIVENVNPFPWDAEITDVEMRLPRDMQLMLCDVDCGSKTPAMVKRVLEWREQNKEEAEMLWDEIHKNNEQILLELKKLRSGIAMPSSANLPSITSSTTESTGATPLTDNSAHGSSLAAASPEQSSTGSSNTEEAAVTRGSLPKRESESSSEASSPSAHSPPLPEFAVISTLFSQTRSLLRTLTQRSGVPIEPPTQTKILDRILTSVDGVIAGVVPGAGGYDALALLLKDNVSVLRNLKIFLAILETERQVRQRAKEERKVEGRGSDQDDDQEGDGAEEIGMVSLLRVVHGAEGMKEEQDLRVYQPWL